jgi:hypothetical protein
MGVILTGLMRQARWEGREGGREGREGRKTYPVSEAARAENQTIGQRMLPGGDCLHFLKGFPLIEVEHGGRGGVTGVMGEGQAGGEGEVGVLGGREGGRDGGCEINIKKNLKRQKKRRRKGAREGWREGGRAYLSSTPET